MSIETRDILKCLPLLASVLGHKYGVKVVIGGEKAFTDGNTIHIPALPVESDEAVVALVKGYTDHESAHIRHTDFDAFRNANLGNAEKTVFNYIEDWRVEQQLAAIFPGCRHNLNRLIHTFFVEQDDWAGETPALVVFNYILLTIRAWDVPEVEEPRRIREYAVDGNYPGLRENLDQILSSVRASCPDTQSSINYAREIVAAIQAWADANMSSRESGTHDMKKEDNAREDSQGHSMNVSDASRKGEDSGNGDPSLVDADKLLPEGDRGIEPEDASPASEAEMEETSDMADGDSKNMAEHAGENTNEASSHTQLLDEMLSALENCAPENLGEKLAEELTRKAAATDGDGIGIASLGPGWSELLPEAERVEALRFCNGLKSRLQGLLQAQNLKGRSSGRRGRLVPRNLYRLSVGNPSMFARETEKKSVSTAVHLLLDRSYSMEGPRIIMARQVCYAISRTLDGIASVNQAVSAFPGTHNWTDAHEIIPIVRHGERTRDNFGILAQGGTPLTEALWRVSIELMEQPEPRKILIIVTDGVPDNIETCKHAISCALKLGIEIYAIGIQTELLGTLGVPGKTIYQLEELPKAVFGLLQNTLLKGGQK